MSTSALRSRLRASLASDQAVFGFTLVEVEMRFPRDRRIQLIDELAAMRDDGEVIFNGPRYQLTDAGRAAHDASS